MFQATLTLRLIFFFGAYSLAPDVLVAFSWRHVYHEQERTSAAHKTEITEANWRHHPKIRAIRHIVSSVEAGLKKGTFKTSQRELECGTGPEMRKIARNSKGVAAWYQDYSEGQDASWDFRYYYDRNGQLRFVFALARSANGTREQLRLYFDDTGKRIWQANKLIKGSGCPGCFSAYVDSDEPLAFEPNKTFANDSGCKETTAQPRRRT